MEKQYFPKIITAQRSYILPQIITVYIIFFVKITNDYKSNILLKIIIIL
jgi:hypothetical protein